MKRVFLSLMAIGCIAASTASAQHVQLSLGAGGVVPTGDYSTLDNAGWELMGALQVGIPMSPLAVRVEGMYGQTSHDPTFLTGTTTLSGGAADLVFRVGAPMVPVKFYLLAGLGYYNVDLSGGSESDVGYNGGAGLSFGVGPMKLFGEARYISVQTSGSAMTFFPVTAGLSFGL